MPTADHRQSQASPDSRKELCYSSRLQRSRTSTIHDEQRTRTRRAAANPQPLHPFKRFCMDEVASETSNTLPWQQPKICADVLPRKPTVPGKRSNDSRWHARIEMEGEEGGIPGPRA